MDELEDKGKESGRFRIAEEGGLGSCAAVSGKKKMLKMEEKRKKK